MKLKSTTLASACFLAFITSNARAAENVLRIGFNIAPSGMLELVGNNAKNARGASLLAFSTDALLLGTAAKRELGF